MNLYRIIVIKLGTGALTSGEEKLDSKIFNSVARQVSVLKRRGIDVIIVSSGAIQAGKEALARIGSTKGYLKKKELAGIGSRHLLNKWGSAFSRHRKEIAQIWVTYANWEDPKEKENVKSAIFDYLFHGVIPIINENDVVSQEEIELMEMGISENDRLARMIASLVKADAVLFLTGVGGVLSGDPNDGDFQIIEKVGENQELKLFGLSENGSGGMEAKIKEGIICKKEGVKRVAIAKLKKDTIISFSDGKRVGTEVEL